MAKKDPSSPKRLRLSGIVILIILSLGIWWLWTETTILDNWKDKALQYVDNRDLKTLESRFSPQQIMEVHKPELLLTSSHSWQEPSTKYSPYLLLNVKYTRDHQTREGVLLWSLVDGEIVLNTDRWETSHGFRDCLDCQANRNDFKIIQSLAKLQGMSTVDALKNDLHVERETLDAWIESAKQKHLIVQKGNHLHLHFQDPKLLITPTTKFQQHIVYKSPMQSMKEPRNYSRNQILAAAKAAFGEDFTIRKEEEVFLPIYVIQINNPDGSIQTTEWNAITGKRIIPYYLNPK